MEKIFNMARLAEVERIDNFKQAYEDKIDEFQQQITINERKNRVFDKKMNKLKRDLTVVQIKREQLNNGMKNDCSKSCGYGE